jgi:hypothetical protein
MKIKEGFVLRKVSDANVVIATGKAALEFNGMITLNSTGVFLWEELQKGCESKDKLAERLLKEYDVSPEIAKKDVYAFVEKLEKENILE